MMMLQTGFLVVSRNLLFHIHLPSADLYVHFCPFKAFLRNYAQRLRRPRSRVVDH